MKKIFLLFFSIFISIFAIKAQNNKVYFNKLGMSTTESQAYYYREKIDGNKYKSHYTSNGNLYFEGKIKSASSSNEKDNVYSSRCTWYYKNGKKKTEILFNDNGIKEGTSYEYFENGKLQKETNYFNGKPKDNRHIEYTLDGQVNRIMEDRFSNNFNDWDLYTSEKSKAEITDNALIISSLTGSGTSRYINCYVEKNTYSIEAKINIMKARKNKSGILWGFKDWDNYNYFLISDNYIFIGSVFEGIKAETYDEMYTSDIKDENLLKILNTGENIIFSINGNIQYSGKSMRNYGSNIGFGVSGKSSISIKNLLVKEIGFKNTSTSNSDMNVKATGTGLIVSESGYIVTNHHVIENDNSILIEMIHQGKTKTYNATVEQKDVDNDLAILKIQDEDFKTLPIQYNINSNSTISVGESVFTIGFPHALGGMGKEAKFNDGKISAKTGFDGAINSFQTSIPVQPGNSGGPVFNQNGELIGIINARYKGGDNVSYAIKLNYLKILLDLMPETFKGVSIAEMTTEDKIKAITKHVVLIKGL